jgi:hypothetical protein
MPYHVTWDDFYDDQLPDEAEPSERVAFIHSGVIVYATSNRFYYKVFSKSRGWYAIDIRQAAHLMIAPESVDEVVNGDHRPLIQMLIDQAFGATEPEDVLINHMERLKGDKQEWPI